jgi:polysaccharide deacetylase family protein (PEP-CTERM system associated)
MRPLMSADTNANFLTIDIEEWYHANYRLLNDEVTRSKVNGTDLQGNVEKLMGVCDSFNIKSTCFVLGGLAVEKPHIVRQISAKGHEIASHGYLHKLVYTISKEEFRADIRKSKRVLEDITGQAVIGYRAPSWSIKRRDLDWFYDILGEEGYSYSSSVYPAYTYLYGIPGFPRYPHFPRINGEIKEVYEIPCPVTRVLGKWIGFSGGFFLRFFPLWFIQYNIRKHNGIGRPVFIYLHPREISVEQPRINLNCLDSFVFYYNVKNTEKKLIRIIKGQNFTPLRDYIRK